MASYNAVKAAVVALTETTGHELAPYGVRAQPSVCPSYFRTGLVDDLQGEDTAARRGDRPASSRPRRSARTTSPPRCSPGIDRGEELILPDPAARAAYDLKLARPGGVRRAACGTRPRELAAL